MKRYAVLCMLIFLQNCFLYGAPDWRESSSKDCAYFSVGRITLLRNVLDLLDRGYERGVTNPHGNDARVNGHCFDQTQQTLDIISHQFNNVANELYPIETVTSMGDIEDRIDLFPLIQGFFNTLKHDVTSIHQHVADAHQNASKDRFYALRARTDLVTAWQQLGDVKNDLQQFIAMIDRQDYQIGQPKTFDERKIAQYLYNKRVRYSNVVPVQYLNLITKWIPKLLSEANQVLPVDQSVVDEFVHEYTDVSNGQTVASQLRGKVLSHMGVVDEFVTDIIIGSGDRKRMLHGIADIIEGRGGFLTKQWKDKIEKLKQSMEPSPQSNMLKRCCNRIFNSMLFRSARVVRWCAIKICFSKNPFDRKDIQKRFAGKFLFFLSRELRKLSGNPPQEQIKTWGMWLRSWFTLNGWRSNS